MICSGGKPRSEFPRKPGFELPSPRFQVLD